MEFRWLLIFVLIVFALVGVLYWHRRRGRTTTAIDGALGIKPAKVMLPDDAGEPEKAPPRRRCGESQELRRKLVHGPYRPMDDRGEPSPVQPRREP